MHPESHLYEELIYIIKGVGATEVWSPGWSIHPGDLNGDGLADLVTVPAHSVEVFLAAGASSFAAPTAYVVNNGLDGVFGVQVPQEA